MPTAEQLARANIDALLTTAGWALQDVSARHIHAARRAAISEFPLESGFGFADYLTGYHSPGGGGAIVESV
ncbi:MAG: hypothetical protein NFCOHLIN_01343 [Gammaproteobacteria bacterium]|nr:hypothetical protein [Gammaproteobacteria bacterium]